MIKMADRRRMATLTKVRVILRFYRGLKTLDMRGVAVSSDPCCASPSRVLSSRSPTPAPRRRQYEHYFTAEWAAGLDSDDDRPPAGKTRRSWRILAVSRRALRAAAGPARPENRRGRIAFRSRRKKARGADDKEYNMENEHPAAKASITMLCVLRRRPDAIRTLGRAVRLDDRQG